MGVGWGALQCPAGWRWRPPAHQGPHSLGPRPTPTPAPAPAGRAEGRGGAAQQLRHWRCGREEHGAQPRLLVTRCHLLLPRRRRAQTMATQAQGWAPANPKAAPLLTPTAPLPHSPCRSLRGDARLPAADPLGLCLTATTYSTSLPFICLTPHFSGGRAGVTSSRKHFLACSSLILIDFPHFPHLGCLF